MTDETDTGEARDAVYRIARGLNGPTLPSELGAALDAFELALRTDRDAWRTRAEAAEVALLDLREAATDRRRIIEAVFPIDGHVAAPTTSEICGSIRDLRHACETAEASAVQARGVYETAQARFVATAAEADGARRMLLERTGSVTTEPLPVILGRFLDLLDGEQSHHDEHHAAEAAHESLVASLRERLGEAERRVRDGIASGDRICNHPMCDAAIIRTDGGARVCASGHPLRWVAIDSDDDVHARLTAALTRAEVAERERDVQRQAAEHAGQVAADILAEDAHLRTPPPDACPLRGPR